MSFAITDLVCTECAIPCEAGSEVVIGYRYHNGSWTFGWYCEHKEPLASIPHVVLASMTCAEDWLYHHPEAEVSYRLLISSRKRHHGPDAV